MLEHTTAVVPGALLIHRRNKSPHRTSFFGGIVVGIYSSYHHAVHLRKNRQPFGMYCSICTVQIWCYISKPLYFLQKTTPFYRTWQRYTNHAVMITLLPTGMGTAQSSPPSLQFSCRAIFVATDMSIWGFDKVFDKIHCDGTEMEHPRRILIGFQVNYINFKNMKPK